MAERPDYVPRLWTQWRINRSFQREPRRVFLWLVIAPVVGLPVTAGAIASGSIVAYALVVSELVGIAQGIVYGPRAYRAMRSRESEDR